jgi:hypothetical protein
MKHVLMTLFFLSGLAVTQLAAQTCAPCPPECAKICKDKKSCEKACKELVAAGKCTPAQAEACKAAVASCTPAEVEMYKSVVASWTPEASDSARTAPSCAPAASVQSATCAPVECKSHKAVAQEGSRRKAAKVVATKG